MPIEDRNLNTGTQLVARYHKQSYSCEVVGGEGGKLRYRLADGREFKSLSAAGMTITGKACNGWTFWSVATAEVAPSPEVQQEAVNQEPVIPAENAETAMVPEIAELGPAKKRIFRIPNQKGVPEGQTRWYCHDCGKSFLVPTGEMPETCPAGHQSS